MAKRASDPDWGLVRQCKRGDMDAFGELVRRHQQSVFNFCLRLLRNVEDAEDIAQDAFVQAYRNIKKFQPRAKFSTWLFAQDAFVQAYRNIKKFQPRAKFSTWLFTIAKNLSLNLIRDEKRGTRRMVPIDDGLEGVTLATAAADQPDSEAIEHETAAVVREAIDRLSPDHKLVIVLRDLEGLSYKEIGQMINCRSGTVKSRLSRARAGLKEVLLDELDRGDLL